MFHSCHVLFNDYKQSLFIITILCIYPSLTINVNEEQDVEVDEHEDIENTMFENIQKGTEGDDLIYQGIFVSFREMSTF